MLQYPSKFFLVLTFGLNVCIPAQTISTYAGTSSSGYSGNNGPATSANMQPVAIAFDAAGNLYVAEYNNNVVRKVSTTGIITVIAGNYQAGYSGDGGSATSAQLHSPAGVAVNSAGALFIADRDNNRIRKVRTAS